MVTMGTAPVKSSSLLLRVATEDRMTVALVAYANQNRLSAHLQRYGRTSDFRPMYYYWLSQALLWREDRPVLCLAGVLHVHADTRFHHGDGHLHLRRGHHVDQHRHVCSGLVYILSGTLSVIVYMWRSLH